MKSLVPASIISFLVYLFYVFLLPANHTWLHGEWVYQDATQHQHLIFDKNGTVKLLTQSGSQLCIYGYLAAKISMRCDNGGKKEELRYTVSGDKKMLSNTKRHIQFKKITES